VSCFDRIGDAPDDAYAISTMTAVRHRPTPRGELDPQRAAFVDGLLARLGRRRALTAKQAEAVTRGEADD